eukprot:CAMPEP_0113980098 /NCGR_PEP_ID=MMETSP0328-20130328/3198_1 /TAXON_ID=39455 /ORGANISM="Alexandrium minutum" /LENGTH=45 /assembly_acc=CAM_ASM_000350
MDFVMLEENCRRAASSSSEPVGEAVGSWGARVWQLWSSTATQAVA